MSENPDNKIYLDLGPQAKQRAISEETGLEVELSMDQRYLIPTSGMLRFVERDIGATHPARILQQYQWSTELSEFGWFDIPKVEET